MTNGAWFQRYEHGVPVTDLVPVAGDGTTGTTVHFRPDQTPRGSGGPEVDDLARLTDAWQLRHAVSLTGTTGCGATAREERFLP
jgi:DNA gyrase/topoisomerase IV subunit B